MLLVKSEISILNKLVLRSEVNLAPLYNSIFHHVVIVAFWSQITNISIIKAWFLNLSPSFPEVSITLFGMNTLLPYLSGKTTKLYCYFYPLVYAILRLYLITYVISRGCLGTLITCFFSYFACMMLCIKPPVICQHKSHAFC